MNAPLVSHVVLVWALLSIVTTAPYLRAFLSPPPGTRFVGFFYYVDDAYNYLSYVQQAEIGSFVFVNKLFIPAHAPALVNLEWWSVGTLSRLLGGHPAASARSASSPAGHRLHVALGCAAGMRTTPSPALLMLSRAGSGACAPLGRDAGPRPHTGRSSSSRCWQPPFRHGHQLSGGLLSLVSARSWGGHARGPAGRHRPGAALRPRNVVAPAPPCRHDRSPRAGRGVWPPSCPWYRSSTSWVFYRVTRSPTGRAPYGSNGRWPRLGTGAGPRVALQQSGEGPIRRSEARASAPSGHGRDTWRAPCLFRSVRPWARSPALSLADLPAAVPPAATLVRRPRGRHRRGRPVLVLSTSRVVRAGSGWSWGVPRTAAVPFALPLQASGSSPSATPARVCTPRRSR